MRKADAVDDVEGDRPPQADLGAVRRLRRPHRQHHEGQHRDAGADDQLGDLIRLGEAARPEAPEQDRKREHHHRGGRIKGDEPTGRHGVAKQREIEAVLRPDHIGVEDLLIAEKRQRQHGQHGQQQAQDAPVGRRQPTAGFMLFAGDGRVDGEETRAGQIDAKPNRHADARRAEAVVPAVDLAQRAADKRRGDDAGADAQIEDLKGVGARIVLGSVQATDLDRDIALEAARPDRKAGQRPQEGYVERHQEVAERHQRGAEQDRPGPPQPAIRDQPAQNRRQVDQTRVDAENRRSERLDRQRAVNAFHHGAELCEPGDALDMPRLKQLPDHVEDQQGLHAVVGKPLPGLGERQIPEADRMAEQASSRRAASDGRGRRYRSRADGRVRTRLLGHDLPPARQAGFAADIPVRTD
ncbi:hypothetical protein D3C72_1016850 [compost metagenome]